MWKPAAGEFPFPNRAALPSPLVNTVINELVNVATMNGAALSGSGGSETQIRDAIMAYVASMLPTSVGDVTIGYTTTGNISLSGLGTQAGGDWTAALAAGDIVLAKDQATASQNGWYVAASGAWARASWADVSAEVQLKNGSLTRIAGGVTLADSLWMLTTDGTITLGTTGLTFSREDSTPGIYGPLSVPTGTTLTVGSANYLNYYVGVSAGSWTMPSAAATPTSKPIAISNLGVGVLTLNAVGGSNFYARGVGGAVTINLAQGESVSLVSDGANWIQLNGNQVPLGVNQTYQDMSGSRAVNTTYTNSKSRPRFVLVSSGVVNSNYYFYINGSAVAMRGNTSGTSIGGFCMIIPPGATYSMNAASYNYWWELDS